MVAGIVVLAVSTAALGMWRLSNDRQQSLTALQQRTDELGRVSSDREQVLTSLQERTSELDKTAAERERTLAALQRQSNELKQLSEERKHALADLQVRTDELLKQTYAGRMGSIRLAMAANRWTRLSALVQDLADNPSRGWEWGHLALATHYGGREEILPKWSVLEPQPDGHVLACAPDGLYDSFAQPVKRTKPLRKGRSFTPKFRRGSFRVVMIDATESPCERPKKNRSAITPAKRSATPKKRKS